MQIFPQSDPGTVRFRVLGPVQVEVGGRLLDIGPRQRRMVLAALAVDAGNPVPIETLVHRVWGAATPDAPRSALYAHVARLRKKIDAETGVKLIHTVRGVGFVVREEAA